MKTEVLYHTPIQPGAPDQGEETSRYCYLAEVFGATASYQAFGETLAAVGNPRNPSAVLAAFLLAGRSALTYPAFWRGLFFVRQSADPSPGGQILICPGCGMRVRIPRQAAPRLEFLNPERTLDSLMRVHQGTGCTTAEWRFAPYRALSAGAFLRFSAFHREHAERARAEPDFPPGWADLVDRRWGDLDALLTASGLPSPGRGPFLARTDAACRQFAARGWAWNPVIVLDAISIMVLLRDPPSKPRNGSIGSAAKSLGIADRHCFWLIGSQPYIDLLRGPAP